MLTMSQINNIKDLSQMGCGISEIKRRTGKDRKTIRKYLEQEDFSPRKPKENKRSSKLDPYKETIKEWLREDGKHWKKQQHTAKRVYDRLVSEKGYEGSYETVQKYLKEAKKEVQTKGSLELIWEPGVAQIDFGEADFVENGKETRKHYLTVTFPYSNNGFCQIFGGETAECVCQGLKDIFTYIGGTPQLLVFDNATGVGHRYKDKVVETELFSRFRAHYGFRVRFCNAYAGYEKGNVENKVGMIRRNLFVPIPSYNDIEEYNRELLEKQLEQSARTHYKKKRKISELFQEDMKYLKDLPPKEFQVCRYDVCRADGYGKICLDGKHYYSTKPELHNQMVYVGIRAHYIDILEKDGSLLVTHFREYGSERTDTSDYSTTLEMLTKNVGAWRNSGIRQDASDVLKNYVDNLGREEQKGFLQQLKRLMERYPYEVSLNAMNEAAKTGAITEQNSEYAASQIYLYGLDTNISAFSILKAYDAFLVPTEEVNT